MSLLIQSKSIWVAQQPVDFRCGVDGLCAFIVEHFQTKPQEGLFIFYNKARNRLKLLVWHHNGFMLIYKRLERGKFPFRFNEASECISLHEKQLQGLLLGLDWQNITEWEKLSFSAYF